jgi:RNA recognition motif. (a.k.a. RRM, RBD, or RNP domain)
MLQVIRRKAICKWMGGPAPDCNSGQSQFSNYPNSWPYTKLVSYSACCIIRRQVCETWHSGPGAAHSNRVSRIYTDSKGRKTHISRSLRTPSTTAATTSCPPFIPMPHYAHGPQHSFTAMDSGFQSPTWSPHPEMLPFSPTMAVFPPTVDQIEYPYYFPYSLPIPVSMPQPMYTENGPDYAPAVLHRGSTPTFIMPNSYRQHGYQIYGYEFHKNSNSVNNDAASYCNTGIPPQRAMSMQATCNVIVDNIRPGVDQQTLKNHFCGAGYMLHCQIIRYNTDGNGGQYNEHNYPAQCYATATFSSAEEAEKAVKMYNGSDLAGSRVVVRLDSEWDGSDDSTTTTTPAGDGSGESDWSRSLSFTTTSTLPLQSSVSESTVASIGTYSAYSGKSSIPVTSMNESMLNNHEYRIPKLRQCHSEPPSQQSKQERFRERVQVQHNYESSHAPGRRTRT